MKRIFLMPLLLALLLTGCFAAQPAASTAPPETTMTPAEDVDEPVETEPWSPWTTFENMEMEKYPGLEPSQMPDFASVASICLRSGVDFSEVMITDTSEIEYVLGQLPMLLEQTCVKDEFEGWTYGLVLLDAEGNEIARVEKIMTAGISYDGYIHVSDCREFYHYFDKYFE